MNNELMNTLLGAVLGFIGSLALNHIQNDKKAVTEILRAINQVENQVIAHNERIDHMATDIEVLKSRLG